MKRQVELIAVDNRYKDTPYPYRCIFDESIGTYLTGQHVDPNDLETVGNLTVDEMTGKTPLSLEKRQKFAFIINPVNRINFMNRQKFDLSTDPKGNPINPKDHAYCDLLRKYGWFVANEREAVIPRKHYFYIKDDIYEAESRLRKSERVYKAEKYVREELTEDGIKDLALVLSYKITSFSYNPESDNDLVVKDRIFEICQKEPDKILDCKQEAYKDDVFIMKLARNEIIKRKGSDFYYGSEYIGGDLDAVKKYMKNEENLEKVSKWNRQLAEKEGRKPSGKISDEKANAVYEEIKELDLDQLKKYAGNKRYKRTEWEDIDDVDKMQKYLISKVTR